MGLRDRAMAILRDPATGLPEFQENDWEKEAMSEIRTTGRASREDLLPLPDSPFLFETDQTLPTDGGLAHQGRVETLLNLVEIIKEVGLADDESDLWTVVLSSLLGQLGVRSAAIYFQTDDRLECKAHAGFIIDDGHQLPIRSRIEKALKKDPAIHYARELIPVLAGEERNWLQALAPELIVPVLKYEDVRGFLMLARPVGGLDFSLDDLVFLKLLGELLGAFESSVARIAYISEQRRLWQIRENQQRALLELARRLGECESQSSAEEALHDTLIRIFGQKMYVLLLREESTFRPVVHRGFQNETIRRMDIPLTEKWLWNLREQRGWQTIEDYQSDPEFSDRLSREDLTVTRAARLLPLFFQRRLTGVFLSLDVGTIPGQEELLRVQEAVDDFFWYLLADKFGATDEKLMQSALEDPLFALKSLIDKHEAHADVNPYAVLSLRIANYDRLANLISRDKMLQLESSIAKMIAGRLRREDFFTRLVEGHYLILMPGADKSQAWQLGKLAARDAHTSFPESDTIAPLLSTRIFARPTDPVTDLKSLVSGQGT